MSKIVWKDNYTREIFFITLFSLILIILTISVFKEYNSYTTFWRIMNFIIYIVLFILIYRVLRRRYIYITRKGLRLGNVIFRDDEKIFLKQKPTFFYWNEIISLKIVSKIEGSGRGSRLADYLILKNKNKKYSCNLKDSTGFVNTLKYLKKENLLDKNSKYFDNREN